MTDICPNCNSPAHGSSPEPPSWELRNEYPDVAFGDDLRHGRCPLLERPLAGGDQVGHELTEDCACGPTVEPVKCKDGSVAWVLIHHSLDGREASQ